MKTHKFMDTIHTTFEYIPMNMECAVKENVTLHICKGLDKLKKMQLIYDAYEYWKENKMG